MDFQEIEKTARRYQKGNEPAHDWQHVQRVAKIGRELAEKEGADPETVRAAALLHDVGRSKEREDIIEDHAEWGAEKAREVLDRSEFPEEKIEDVVHCIRTHRYSTGPEPETLEARVLFDADNLDSMGAVGIARSFSFAGERGNAMVDPEIPPEKDDTPDGRTALNHLEKRMLELRDLMHTDAARRIAEEKHEFVEQYIERFKKEMRIS
ncbi:MAG: HD domain-containing protein [Candidatus Nanohaloarchaea archaeon]